MSRNDGTVKTSRREFLRDVAAAGGIAAIAAGSGPAQARAPAAAPERAASRPKGYRVTPHVAKYYEKARI